MSFLYICAIIVLIVFALFFGFKYKQVEGADYKNKRLRDRHGAGSFTTSVSNFLAKIFWGGLVVISILLGIFCFAKMSEIDNPKKIDSQDSGASQPLAIQNQDSKSTISNSKNTLSIISVPGDNSSSTLQNKIYTEQEIKDLEEKVQYSGDDPVIRMRLGLPPKN